MNPPSIHYYGCLFRGTTQMYSRHDTIAYHETPWSYELDEVLVQDGDLLIGMGHHVRHKDGWTAVVFWDNSLDKRPFAISVFLVAKNWTKDQVLNEARKQWPEVFERAVLAPVR